TGPATFTVLPNAHPLGGVVEPWCTLVTRLSSLCARSTRPICRAPVSGDTPHASRLRGARHLGPHVFSAGS
ncbi:MAG TPA: hypothetical protein VLW50_19105, partial [Streptosporangiaceae bacterium]|nr:hypothetical protein [Streptosporangiaceae bacterium]